MPTIVIGPPLPGTHWCQARRGATGEGMRLLWRLLLLPVILLPLTGTTVAVALGATVNWLEARPPATAPALRAALAAADVAPVPLRERAAVIPPALRDRPAAPPPYELPYAPPPPEPRPPASAMVLPLVPAIHYLEPPPPPVRAAPPAATAAVVARAAPASLSDLPPLPPLRHTIGRSHFDDAQVISIYGHPNSCTMGELGCRSPQAVADYARELARQYDALNGDRGAIAAFHLIVDVAQRAPQRDGSYLARMSHARIQEWIELARANDMLIFLDLQIGWADPLTTVDRVAPYLAEPFVHLAIDPEFATASKGRSPGEVIGVLAAHDVNRIQQCLAAIVREHELPPKLLVLHQFRPSMLANPEAFHGMAEVEITIDMDGWGHKHVKFDGYRKFALADYAERSAFKLFIKWDIPLLTVEQITAMDHLPDYVIYQ